MGWIQVIRNRAGLRASLSNIGWLSGDRILRLFGGVVITTVVARYLGPAQYGLLNYGLAIYAIFNIVSNLGLDFLVVREIALKEDCEPKVLGTAFVLKAAASVVTTIIAIVVSKVLEPDNVILIEIVAIMSIAAISQAFDVIDFFFQAQTQSRYTVMARTSVFLLASVARVIAVLLHAQLMTFAWIGGFEILFSELALGASYLRFRRPLPRWKWHFPVARGFLAESWPLLVSSLMIMIYMRCDQILLGKMATTADVGQYSVAVRLSEIWYSIPTIICVSVMPRLLKGLESDPQKYYARLERLYESMILVSIIVGIATQLAGPLVVRLLFGSKFGPAARILDIHIWTGVFVSVGVVGGQQIIQEKIVISSLYKTLAGAIVNVVLNILWIPRWGTLGSATATLVAYSVSAYFADTIHPRTRHIFLIKTRAYLHFWAPIRFALQGTTE